MTTNDNASPAPDLDDMAERFVAMCVTRWTAMGLPVAVLATALISHGLTVAVEVEGNTEVAAAMRRWATVLSAVGDAPPN